MGRARILLLLLIAFVAGSLFSIVATATVLKPMLKAEMIGLVRWHDYCIDSARFGSDNPNGLLMQAMSQAGRGVNPLRYCGCRSEGIH